MYTVYLRVARQANRQTEIHKKAKRLTRRPTDKQRNKQTDREANRPTDRTNNQDSFLSNDSRKNYSGISGIPTATAVYHRHEIITKEQP